MSTDQRKAEYSEKARQAEEQAEKAKDEPTKAAWLGIAAGYHDLLARLERPR